ncbi:hypothetical protein EDB80DRAFT_743560 [Ilyonectria destructans]|nr:hypothetical protein EDB80DRAFT_743560 [Ilyonectria destructans]
MTQKIWFLPPDFTFLPDGELALGTVIPYPHRPTLSLASLGSDAHPEITLPGVETLTEIEHNHTYDSKRSLGADLFAKFVDLASAIGNTNVSRYKNTSLGSVDLEVRTFRKGICADALKAIVGLDSVKKHINSGHFRQLPVYIISGLCVAKESFEVRNEAGSSKSTSVSGSGNAPLGGPFIESGVSISSSNGQSRTDSYKSAPGVVFAYRLHVIRMKRNGDVETELYANGNGRVVTFSVNPLVIFILASAKLFSFLKASLRGEGEDKETEDEEAEEIEYTEVTSKVLNDLIIGPNSEYPISELEKLHIVFENSVWIQARLDCGFMSS